MRTLVTSVLVVLLLVPALAAEEGILNAGFEQGSEGRPPLRWFLPPGSRNAGFALETSTDDPFEGKQCALLRFTKDGRPRGFGNVMQVVDAKPYRGKRVKLTGAVRVEGMAGRAQMWMRVDREGNERGFFDNMGDRPIRSPTYKVYTIEGDVHDDATALNVGVMLMGGGKVFVDAFALEVVGGALPPYEPEGPQPLRGRALDNVVAFAKLFGYVRHFHPSDEAAAADWSRTAIAGVRAVEGAKSGKDLAERLQAFFEPVAPTLIVHPKSRPFRDEPGAEPPETDGPLYLRQWRHHGFGQEGGIYRSERMRARVGESGLPEGFADPGKAFRADLGGGVACVLPLAVWADEDGTLERASGPPPSERLPRNHEATGNDRGTRLADVILAWNVFQHFYPYFDVVETDWEAELEKALVAAAEDEDARALLATLQRMVAALHDGHGNVFHPELGPRFVLPLRWGWIEDRLVVTQVGETLAGRIAPGDVVEAIDGTEAEKALGEAEERISGATPQWKRYRALMEVARSSSDDPVKLRIRVLAENDAKRTVGVVPGPFEEIPREPRPGKVAELEKGIWYVDLDRITDEDFRSVLPELEEATGIVFDMRGYPNHLQFGTWMPHLMKEPGTSAQWRVPLVTRPDREDMTCPRRPGWQLTPQAPYLEAKRAFVLDGRAISYAESCMGIVENYQLGEIVGEASAGTNGNVNPFTLPGGYRVIWTGMQVLKHDGSQHHGVGILPTVPVARTRAGVAAGRDERLERAIEAVK